MKSLVFVLSLFLAVPFNAAEQPESKTSEEFKQMKKDLNKAGKSAEKAVVTGSENLSNTLEKQRKKILPPKKTESESKK